MEVAATAKHNRWWSRPSSSTPQSQKDCWKSSASRHRNCPCKGDIDPCHYRDEEIIRSHQNPQPSNQEQSGSDWRAWGRKRRSGRPGSKIPRWRDVPHKRKERSHPLRRRQPCPGMRIRSIRRTHAKLMDEIRQREDVIPVHRRNP